VVWEKDITTLTVAAVMRRLNLRRGQLDLLAGCPPCQGFSRMTTLNGRRSSNDPRNDLIFQFLRFVRGLRPKAVMMENVPEFSRDQRIEDVVTELESMGYICNRSVLDAADYGVPQRRRRFILVAGRGEKIPFGQPARRKRTVKEAFQKLKQCVKADPLQNLPETRSDKVKALIRRIPRDGGSRMDMGDEWPAPPKLIQTL